MLTQIREKSQITIPKEIVKKLELKAGDHINIELEDNKIILKPVIIIPKDQEWFFKKEWQMDEKKADEDINLKKITKEMSLEQALNYLDSLKKEVKK